MDTPLQIVFDGMDTSDHIENLVREKAKKMERYYDHIVAGQVTIKRDNKRHKNGPIYDMTIEMNVPGKKLVVSHKPGDRYRHERHLVALVNDSFDAMAKQLEHHSQKVRGEVKAHPAPLQGRIQRLFKEQDYGFVKLTDGREIYFHKNSVVDKEFADLKEDMPVRIVMATKESPVGPQATTVKPISDMQFVDRP